MEKLAIIGAGISGLTAANLLKDRFNTTVFEKSNKPGGLIKCDKIDGNLYHMVGGHIFNSKRQDVLDLFWSFFKKEEEFTKSLRDARIAIPKEKVNDFNLIGYPIEDHVYQLEEEIQKSFIDDLIQMISSTDKKAPQNFEEFLKTNFGETLYKLYFKPYNEKIWKNELSKISLSWLEGKLPMPKPKDILFRNFSRQQERNFVHSSFYYPKNNGSQFIADRLAKGLNIRYNSDIKAIEFNSNKWIINSKKFDNVIFCGNIKDLDVILKGTETIKPYVTDINNLEFHGTTTALCTIDEMNYSWIYMPDKRHSSHRIIGTGNFSKNNNGSDKLSVTLEFTDYKSKEEIQNELKLIPYTPQYIAHRYTKYTYPIQDKNTRELIRNIKEPLAKNNFYLLGRFADWEYYNMDTAIGAVLDLNKNLA